VLRIRIRIILGSRIRMIRKNKKYPDRKKVESRIRISIKVMLVCNTGRKIPPFRKFAVYIPVPKKNLKILE
jgi:hypothetical protein